MVMAVVDSIGVVAGGCASIISNDMAVSTDELRCVTGVVRLFSVWVVASVVCVVVCMLNLMQSVICAFFSEVGPLLLGGSICREVHKCSGAGLVCMAGSEVVMVACIGVPQGLVFVCFAIHHLHSSFIPPSCASSSLSCTSLPHCL